MDEDFDVHGFGDPTQEKGCVNCCDCNYNIGDVLAQEREDNPMYVIENVRGLRAGDILHISVGILNMGDGQPPWIPGPEELGSAVAHWQKVVPEGVQVIATHFGEVPEVIQVAATDGTE